MLNTSTGLITGTLGPNADRNISYTVTVTAGDGIAAHTVSQTFTWTVAHLALTNPGNQFNADGDSLTNSPLQLQGHDADGDNLTYTLTGGDPMIMHRHHQQTVASWATFPRSRFRKMT